MFRNNNYNVLVKVFLVTKKDIERQKNKRKANKVSSNEEEIVDKANLL